MSFGNKNDSVAAIPKGTLIGQKYRIIELIAKGGMGSVFRGVNERIDLPVAIKILSDTTEDPESYKKTLARFEREGKLVCKINHPNVVNVFDYEIENGIPCLIMEYVDGTSLKEHISRRPGVGIPRVSEISEQICSALKEAHSSGIIHRDLKPSNVLLTEGPSGSLLVKVVDFGIAKYINPSNDDTDVTLEGNVVGTPAYMSPEQINEEDIDERSDLYSLAIVIFEMISGVNPFKDPAVAKTLLSHVAERRPLLSDYLTNSSVAEGLDPFFKRAFAVRKSERYPDVSQFQTAFCEHLKSGAKENIWGKQVIEWENDRPTVDFDDEHQEDYSQYKTPVIGKFFAVLFTIALIISIAIGSFHLLGQKQISGKVDSIFKDLKIEIPWLGSRENKKKTGYRYITPRQSER